MNKKGMTLVEIIISIVLISIVLIFLFSLLITVKDMNDESEVNSTYLINKSLILKNIEEDLDKAESVTLVRCDISDFYTSYTSDYINDLNDDQKANKCIGFKFDGDDTDIGYLGIYYYKRSETEETKNGYVISYIHGDVRATRQLPNYEEISKNIEVDSNNIINTWTLNDENIEYKELTGFNVIKTPIIGPDGKDYSINISYYN